MVGGTEDSGVLWKWLLISVLQHPASLTKGDCGSYSQEQGFRITPAPEFGKQLFYYFHICSSV